MLSNRFKKMILSILAAVVLYTAGAVGLKPYFVGQRRNDRCNTPSRFCWVESAPRRPRREIMSSRCNGRTNAFPNLYLDRHGRQVDLSEGERSVYNFFSTWKAQASAQRPRSRDYLAQGLLRAFTSLRDQPTTKHVSFIQRLLHVYKTSTGSISEKQDIIFHFAETYLRLRGIDFRPKSAQP